MGVVLQAQWNRVERIAAFEGKNSVSDQQVYKIKGNNEGSPAFKGGCCRLRRERCKLESIGWGKKGQMPKKGRSHVAEKGVSIEALKPTLQKEERERMPRIEILARGAKGVSTAVGERDVGKRRCALRGAEKNTLLHEKNRKERQEL